LTLYSIRIIKRYPGDRGIRFGSVTLIALVCTAVALRIPWFARIFDSILPVIVFPILILLCATLFFLVQETIMDVRASRAKKDLKNKQ
jgi:hypothetical protein